MIAAEFTGESPSALRSSPRMIDGPRHTMRQNNWSSCTRHTRRGPCTGNREAPASHRLRSRAGGFTLIELMITIAVATLLLVIALPSYRAYVTRGRLTEAFTQLTAMGVALEQYNQDNRTYAGACGNGGNAPLPAATANFAYSCPTLSATGYLIQATGQPGSNTAGFTFTLTQNGARATPNAPSGWPTSASCWINSRSANCS